MADDEAYWAAIRDGKLTGRDVADFLALVTRMRHAQRSYFDARRRKTEDVNRWLVAARDLERQVDRVVADLQPSPEPRLF